MTAGKSLKQTLSVGISTQPGHGLGWSMNSPKVKNSRGPLPHGCTRITASLNSRLRHILCFIQGSALGTSLCLVWLYLQLNYPFSHFSDRTQSLERIVGTGTHSTTELHQAYASSLLSYYDIISWVRHERDFCWDFPFSLHYRGC